jgi:hypothetical protein
MLEKPCRAQTGRLTALEDRAGNVRGEIGQADDPGLVRSVQLLVPGEFTDQPGLPGAARHLGREVVADRASRRSLGPTMSAVASSGQSRRSGAALRRGTAPRSRRRQTSSFTSIICSIGRVGA